MITARNALLRTEARASHDARSILADSFEDVGRHDVAMLYRDQLPYRDKTRKRVDKMTSDETAQMRGWTDKWTKIALTTGAADRPLFEAAIDSIYRSMGKQSPIVTWTEAPIVAVLAAPIAAYFLAGGAVHSAVDSAVGSAVDSAVRSAVHLAVYSAVLPTRNERLVTGWTQQNNADLKEVYRQVGYRWLGGQFWAGWHWGAAYTTFMLDVLRLDIGRDLEIKARAYAATAQSACYWFPLETHVFVSERPAVIENGGGRWPVGGGQWVVTK